MASPPKDILIIGATGLIGRFILEELIAAKASFGKLAIFTSKDTLERKSAELESLKSHGVEIVVGDLTDTADIKRAYQGVDTVVSAVGRPIIDKQIKLLEIAEATDNVKYFYPSEYGTDIEYGPQSKDEKPHQLKLKVRKYIREHVKRLQYTYLVTGPYADLYIGRTRNEKAGSFDSVAKKATLLGTGDEKISLTTMRDVGRLAVASLKHPEASRNRALKVNSFTTTPREILAEFEKQTGAKWAVDYTSLDELKELERLSYEQGQAVGAGGVTLRRIWTEGGTLYEKRDNDLIGPVQLDSLADIVGEVIKQSIKFRMIVFFFQIL